MQNADEEVLTPDSNGLLPMDSLPPNGMELDMADGGGDTPLGEMLNNLNMAQCDEVKKADADI